MTITGTLGSPTGGQVTVMNGATLTENGTLGFTSFTNSGTYNGGLFSGGDPITNTSTGVVNGNLNFNTGGLVLNQGTWNATTISNTATISNTPGTLTTTGTINATTSVTNSGTLNAAGVIKTPLITNNAGATINVIGNLTGIGQLNDNGTLNLGGVGLAVGSLSGAGTVTNNGSSNAVLTNQGASSTFSGVIEDGGSSATSLVQNSPGNTLILTGNSTYSGTTTIAAGTLQLGNGGTSGQISSDAIDNGTLAFDRSDIVNATGIISGTGSVAQIGTGTTVLAGANTYTGQTNVTRRNIGRYRQHWLHRNAQRRD